MLRYLAQRWRAHTPLGISISKRRTYQSTRAITMGIGSTHVVEIKVPKVNYKF